MFLEQIDKMKSFKLCYLAGGVPIHSLRQYQWMMQNLERGM